MQKIINLFLLLTLTVSTATAQLISPERLIRREDSRVVYQHQTELLGDLFSQKIHKEKHRFVIRTDYIEIDGRPLPESCYQGSTEDGKLHVFSVELDAQPIQIILFGDGQAILICVANEEVVEDALVYASKGFPMKDFLKNFR